MSAPATEQRRPPEGYGVVPIGNRFQPVRWAPEHGEGAYHPLESDERGAEGTPKMCATAAAAVDWLHVLVTPRQASIFGDEPVAKKAKPTKAKKQRAKKTPATPPAPAPAAAPAATPKKNPGPLGRHWKWGEGKKKRREAKAS
jgi:hypothetical protein